MTAGHLRCALQDARVHCAVLKERTTTHPHPPPTPAPPQQGPSWYGGQASPARKSADQPPGDTVTHRSPLSQDPTACLQHPTTTTRVPTHTPLTGRTPVKGQQGCTSGQQQPAHRTGQCSTLELHPTHIAQTPELGPRLGAGMALDHPAMLGGQCSLERR
jgi:hypothetical protein